MMHAPIENYQLFKSRATRKGLTPRVTGRERIGVYHANCIYRAPVHAFVMHRSLYTPPRHKALVREKK